MNLKSIHLRLCDTNPGNNLILSGCCHIDMKDQGVSKVIKIYIGPICNENNPAKNKSQGKT